MPARDPIAPMATAPTVVDLALGYGGQHECARMSDRTVRCRGANWAGQLGRGAASERLEAPETVPGLRGVAQVVTYPTIGASCARLDDGTVRCWGSNGGGWLGVGREGDEPCRSQGEGRPCRTRPTRIPLLDGVIQLSAHFPGFCALRRDGTVWCWGPTAPDGPTQDPQLHDVAGVWSKSHELVVRLRDGTLRTALTREVLDVPANAEMASGLLGAICFRLPNTTVRCMGRNNAGEVGNGTSSPVAAPIDPGLRGVRSIAAGFFHTCAAISDGSVWCWGAANEGAVGPSQARLETCRSSRGEPFDCVTRPARVSGIDDVERVFAGAGVTCALRRDRTVWCWGRTEAETITRTPTRIRW